MIKEHSVKEGRNPWWKKSMKIEWPTGQAVPSDIAFPDSEHLSAMVLRNEVAR